MNLQTLSSRSQKFDFFYNNLTVKFAGKTSRTRVIARNSHNLKSQKNEFLQNKP